MNYWEYLQSDSWQKKREHVFSIFGKKCFFCQSDKHIQIHHKRYSKKGFSILGKEKTGKDIIPLCDKCHALWHKYHGSKKMNKNHQRKQKELLLMNFDVEGSICLCDKNITSKHFSDRLFLYKNRTRDMRVLAH